MGPINCICNFVFEVASQRRWVHVMTPFRGIASHFGWLIYIWGLPCLGCQLFLQLFWNCSLVRDLVLGHSVLWTLIVHRIPVDAVAPCRHADYPVNLMESYEVIQILLLLPACEFINLKKWGLSVLQIFCFVVGLYQLLLLFIGGLGIQTDRWATWVGRDSVIRHVLQFLHLWQVWKLLFSIHTLSEGLHVSVLLVVAKLNLLLVRSWLSGSQVLSVEVVKINHHLVAEVKHVQRLGISVAFISWVLLHIHWGHVHRELSLIILVFALLFTACPFFVWNFIILGSSIKCPIDLSVLDGVGGQGDRSIVVFVSALDSFGVVLGCVCAPAGIIELNLLDFLVFIHQEHHLGLTLLIRIWKTIESICCW